MRKKTRKMGFLLSSQSLDDSYVQNLSQSPIILGVFSVIFAVFVYASYRTCSKKREDLNFVQQEKPATKCGVIFHKISRLLFLLNLLAIIITSGYFHSGRFLAIISSKVDNAWDFRNHVLQDMKTVDTLLHIEADDSVCNTGTACDIHPFDPIFRTIRLIIDTFENVPSQDIIDSAENIFKNLVTYTEMVHGVGYAIIIMGVFYCFVGSYISPSAINKHRWFYIVLPICVGFLLIVFSSFFYVAGVVLSDTCRNTSDIIWQASTDDTLNFYYNCNPNIDRSYPKIITTESAYTDHFKSIDDDNMMKIGCTVDRKLANVKTRFFQIQKKVLGCCKGCNSTLLDNVLDIVGNDNNMTGLWKDVSCEIVHNKLHDATDALCDLFTPFFSNFILYLSLGLHVLFAF